MKLTSGFITLAVCGLLAVALPSLFVGRRLWNKGGYARVLSVFGGSTVVLFVLLAFEGVDLPGGLEEAVLTFFLFWGMSFYAFVCLVGLAKLFKHVAMSMRRFVEHLRRQWNSKGWRIVREHPIVIGLVLAFVIGVSQRDFFVHHDTLSVGQEVRLISTSDSFAPTDAMQPFVHAYLRDDELHLVIRSWFYNDGSIPAPYISVDAQGHGVLHIEVMHFPFVASKCEFLKQLEIAIPSDRWRRLESLRVFNEDTHEFVGMPFEISDTDALLALQELAHGEAAHEGLSPPGIRPGC